MPRQDKERASGSNALMVLMVGGAGDTSWQSLSILSFDLMINTAYDTWATALEPPSICPDLEALLQNEWQANLDDGTIQLLVNSGIHDE